MGKVVKRCACGCEYTAEEWGELPYVGEWDDGTEVFELRQCVCKSSIAIVLRPSAALFVCDEVVFDEAVVL